MSKLCKKNEHFTSSGIFPSTVIIAIILMILMVGLIIFGITRLV